MVTLFWVLLAFLFPFIVAIKMDGTTRMTIREFLSRFAWGVSLSFFMLMSIMTETTQSYDIVYCKSGIVACTYDLVDLSSTFRDAWTNTYMRCPNGSYRTYGAETKPYRWIAPNTICNRLKH